jgi:tetraacyldisaccharide-1-P 4'-kinase
MGKRKYFFLYPFSLLYRLITDIRNFLYDKGFLSSTEFSIPIICAGNITAARAKRLIQNTLSGFR